MELAPTQMQRYDEVSKMPNLFVFFSNSTHKFLLMQATEPNYKKISLVSIQESEKPEGKLVAQYILFVGRGYIAIGNASNLFAVL